MGDVLKGWWIKGRVSYSVAIHQTINRSKNFETFQMRINPVTNDTTYQRYGTKSDQRNSSSTTYRGHVLYGAVSTGYSHKWEENSFNALVRYGTYNSPNNSTLPNNFNTLAGRVQYSIQNKYIIEAAASYSGNNRHQPSGRYGFFPAGGIAWNIQNEGFFNKNGFINRLKLRASYGLTGNSITGIYGDGYYQYISRYGSTGGYHFGTSGAFVPGLAEVKTTNLNTWEKGLELDVGVDLSFSGNRGNISIDYYHNKIMDIPQSRGKNSAVLGWGRSILENLGKNLYQGMGITAGWADQISSFSYYISGNVSLRKSKILFNDEPTFLYPWMQRTGNKVGQIYGYVADGFVMKPGGGPVLEGYTSVPGDIKYKDLNGDGLINQLDRKAIGTKKPLMFYGANLGFSWKHLSLHLLIQGVTNHDALLTGAGEWAFLRNGAGQAYQHNLNRWTPETASSATYPRLSIGRNPNNDVASSFWVHSISYVRLRNAGISYSFNNIALGHIEQLRIFLNGLNLLTFSAVNRSKLTETRYLYPIHRVVNAGISIKL
jgi:hypothetical protein